MPAGGPVFEPPDHPYRVPFDGSFRVPDVPTAPPDDAPGRKEARKELDDVVERLEKMQRRLYAADRNAVLLIFQAIDAAGKDSTIRAVTRGINPAGFQVSSFKQPSANELDQDFLWRTSRALPQRGRIGIFNRSYYEEVLVVRVHPEYLKHQQLPNTPPRAELRKLWDQRYESIRDHERHLARNGTVVVKFWLNVSKQEQRQRFLDRIDDPKKQWKFSAGDIRERGFWDDYMQAYEEALNATSRPWAPWYAIPADDKPVMRLTVAQILEQMFESLDPRFPEIDGKAREELKEMRRALEAED